MVDGVAKWSQGSGPQLSLDVSRSETLRLCDPRLGTLAAATARLPSRAAVRAAETTPGIQPQRTCHGHQTGGEEKATEGGPESEYESWVELHTRREHNWLQIFSHLWKEDDIQLAGIVFDGVDKLQHLCWRFIHPQLAASLTTDREKRIRDLCLEYYRSLDRTIEQMADQAGPETTILIASDHGFGSTQDVFHVNAWLGKKGYLTWSESSRKEQEDQSALLGVGSVARHTYMLDWDGTRAFTTTPTSNGVYIVASPNGDSKGVSQSQYESFREQLMADLMELTVPGTGEPVVSEIWTREEAFSGPQMSLAPDLTLGLRDGGLVSILPSQESITSRPEIAGAHRPEGVFMARGPGIRKGWTSSELSILDVMPSMLYCLDLPVPDDLEGHVPEEIFEPEVIRTRPVKTGWRSGACGVTRSAAERPDTGTGAGRGSGSSRQIEGTGLHRIASITPRAHRICQR